jgi:signal transduction histidine kinase
LTIARSLVAAHGGEIRASSAPHGGTTMTFTLPRI